MGVCVCCVPEQRVKVVGQRYYSLYMSSVQNAVASNKYKCEGCVCNDRICCETEEQIEIESGRESGTYKLNKNKLSLHIHTANRRLSVLDERANVYECEFVFAAYIHDACAHISVCVCACA